LEYTSDDLKIISHIVHLAHSDPEFRMKFFKNPRNMLDQFNASDNAKILILRFFEEMKK